MPNANQFMWFGAGVIVGYFVAPMLLSRLSGKQG